LVPAESATQIETQRPAFKAVTAEVAAPVGSRGFGDEVGQRLVWMAGQGHQAAELRLNPPELGPVEVRLTLSSDQASLTILSPHAAVRDAVQSNLPRLQDMLQSVGVNLGSVFVGSQGSGQPFGERPDFSPGSTVPGAIHGASGPATASGISTAGSVRLGLGVVDTYA
jgi:flagellar hook-length control protein FliK